MPGSNELIVFVICLLLCLCVVGSARSVSNTVHLTPQHQHNTNPVQTIGQQPIDESFYSRQLFVYGKSAQEKMSQGTVLVVGQGLLIDEVVKNLALTGVGHLLLAETSSTDPARLSIRGNESSLLSYVKSLNPRVKVENWTVDAILGGECLSTRPVDVIIVCDSNLHLWKEINHLSRRHNVKMVGCQSLGLMGVLFNDFLEGFEVEDLDGESYPEIPLTVKHAWERAVRSGAEESMLTVHTIPEERLTCGLQAPITIRSTQHPENVLCHGEIDEVCSPHSCRIRIRGPLSTDHKALLEGILSAGEAILQPEKRRAVLNFESLSSQLQRPTLAAQNAADIPAQALARATTLFAAMKVAAVMLTDAKPVATHGRNSNDDNRAVWREAIEQEVSFLRKLQRGRPRTKREEERQARAFTALQTNGWVDQLIDNLFLVQSHAHFRENAAVVSVMGGLAAEEVVKALTGLHSPVQQFFCFEALRALPHGFLYGDSSVPFRAASKASATALREIYAEMRRQLNALRIAVVGAGAIGCETVKNLVLLSAGRRGGVTLTDPDSIERTNLHRQLLYREQHLGRAKALVAAEVARSLDPGFQILGLEEKVESPSSSSPQQEQKKKLTASLWRSRDVILTALDNLEGRLAVDGLAVRYGKFLVDSGTQGTKANVQVVAPYVTEPYSASSDPPDQAVPVCTIKTFPYHATHCVAWAREVFQELFYERVSQLSHLSQSIRNDGHEGSRLWLETASTEDRFWIALLLADLPISALRKEVRSTAADDDAVAAALRWAERLFRHLFVQEVEALLQAHPPTSRDEDAPDGETAFWSGARRCPSPLPLDWKDAVVAQFLSVTAALRLRSLGRAKPSTLAALQETLRSHHPAATAAARPQDPDLVYLLSSQAAAVQWISQPFDKDATAPGGATPLDWVVAAAQLRCRVYRIPPPSTLQAQRVAGQIIPAIASATAVAAGLAAIEVLTFASERVAQSLERQGHEIGHWKANTPSRWRRLRDVTEKWLRRALSGKERNDRSSQTPLQALEYAHREKTRLLARFRNSFLNWATASAYFSAPMPAAAVESSGGATPWDRVVVVGALSRLSVAELEKSLQSMLQAPVEVVSVVRNDMLLYAEFAQSDPLDRDAARARPLGESAGALMEDDEVLEVTLRRMEKEDNGEEEEEGDEEGDEQGEEVRLVVVLRSEAPSVSDLSAPW